MRVRITHGLPLAILTLGLLALGSGRAGAAGKAAYGPSGPYAKTAEIAGAEAIGSDQCAGCHESAAASFRRSPHAFESVGCEDCHGRGSLHSTDAEAHGHIHKFGSEPAATANAACLQCHSDHAALLGWSTARHARAGVRCVDCHRVHGQAPGPWTRQAQNEACARCHAQQVAEGGLPYHHPVREGSMGCADCHDPHGGSPDAALRASQVNELCFQCHAEYQGPFTYQHPPVTESCLKCHAPHGSMNAHLLQVSEPMLCLQCHSGHHNGSGIPLMNACTNCHGSIHGTDTPSATGGSVFIDK